MNAVPVAGQPAGQVADVVLATAAGRQHTFVAQTDVHHHPFGASCRR